MSAYLKLLTSLIYFPLLYCVEVTKILVVPKDVLVLALSDARQDVVVLGRGEHRAELTGAVLSVGETEGTGAFLGDPSCAEFTVNSLKIQVFLKEPLCVLSGAEHLLHKGVMVFVIFTVVIPNKKNRVHVCAPFN
jgi:hypothetical protein